MTPSRSASAPHTSRTRDRRRDKGLAGRTINEASRGAIDAAPLLHPLASLPVHGRRASPADGVQSGNRRGFLHRSDWRRRPGGIAMERQPRILVVDDTPRNIKVMEASLAPRGYAISGVTSGAAALHEIATQPPDLVLLDVIMPGMDGFEVCRRLRAEPATHLLPVVMITASGDQEKVSALEAGADDFVQKPFNQAELLARVASLLRIKTYHDTIQRQAAELAEWNQTLAARVQDQVAELERLGRLRRFLSPQVAALLVSAEGEALLESHRRQIAVVCCQVPGFSELADAAAPEEVLAVLRAYHEALGGVIHDFEGTVGPLVEDRLTVLFNDPLPTED